MKQLFIKDTNKRYSIREDGVVINNKLNKLLTCRQTTLKGKRIDISSHLLLIKYFGYTICPICNKKSTNKIDLNKKRIHKCNNCVRKSNVFFVKRWKKLNPEINKIHNDKSYRKNRDSLHRCYIGQLLNMPLIYLNEHLEASKRQQMILYRELKKIKDGRTKEHGDK